MTAFRGLFGSFDAEFLEHLGLGDDRQEIADLLDTLRINPQIFAGNAEQLITGGNPLLLMHVGSNAPNLPTSPSIKKFTPKHDRPGNTPVWAMAAIPDVLDWFNSKYEAAAMSGRQESLMPIIGLDPTKAATITEKDVHNAKGHFLPVRYLHMTNSYRAETNKALESALSPASRSPGCGCGFLAGLVVASAIFFLVKCHG